VRYVDLLVINYISLVNQMFVRISVFV